MECSADAQPGEQVLAILGFHNIGGPPAGDWDTWFYVSEATFGGLLGRIQENAWRVIDLPTFLVGLAAPASLPERSVLLTFDDGYQSMRRVALPWLLRFGYPGVLFVPTDYIGMRNEFDAGIEPPEAICDWDDLRELERQGVSVQSRRSKATLEAGLGKPVEVIAYPLGDGGANQQGVERALERTGYRARHQPSSDARADENVRT